MVRRNILTVFRLPHRNILIAYGLLLLIALAAQTFFWRLAFCLALAMGLLLRWQSWRVEWVILTRKRVVRVRGIWPTITSEASLRVDRIAGARLVITFPGRIFGYGTIELEAPGDHPDFKHLNKIQRPHEFYARLRDLLVSDTLPPDPDDSPTDYVTEPLPPVAKKF